MARVLSCVDPVPASDGTCQTTAWIEQAGIADMMPTVEEGNTVGMAIFTAFVMLGMFRLLKPKKGDEE